MNRNLQTQTHRIRLLQNSRQVYANSFSVGIFRMIDKPCMPGDFLGTGQNFWGNRTIFHRQKAKNFFKGEKKLGDEDIFTTNLKKIDFVFQKKPF